jgi:NADPH-dependent ferric siderophore reductase
LFLPRESGTTSFDVPKKANLSGYVRFRRMPTEVRPHLRNYTVRDLRPREGELDVDFVVHGEVGIASRWAQRTEPGDRVALLDQGRGFDLDPAATEQLLVADETGMPAVLGILRDLPEDARGHAYVELPDPADAQPVVGPAGVEVHWLPRSNGQRPGSVALETVRREWRPGGGVLSGYLVGGQALPAGLRRWLVAEHQVPKRQITFVGYWRLGKVQD